MPMVVWSAPTPPAPSAAQPAAPHLEVSIVQTPWGGHEARLAFPAALLLSEPIAALPMETYKSPNYNLGDKTEATPEEIADMQRFQGGGYGATPQGGAEQSFGGGGGGGKAPMNLDLGATSEVIKSGGNLASITRLPSDPTDRAKDANLLLITSLSNLGPGWWLSCKDQSLPLLAILGVASAFGDFGLVTDTSGETVNTNNWWLLRGGGSGSSCSGVWDSSAGRCVRSFGTVQEGITALVNDLSDAENVALQQALTAVPGNLRALAQALADAGYVNTTVSEAEAALAPAIAQVAAALPMQNNWTAGGGSSGGTSDDGQGEEDVGGGSGSQEDVNGGGSGGSSGDTEAAPKSLGWGWIVAGLATAGAAGWYFLKGPGAAASSDEMMPRPRSGDDEEEERLPNPAGMQVQTLIFNKEHFTRKQAVSWAKSHDYKAAKVDENDTSYRLRQKPPSKFNKKTFRTIRFKEGLQAVVGRPSRKANPLSFPEKITPDDADHLARTGSGEMRAWMAGHPASRPETLDYLARNHMDIPVRDTLLRYRAELLPETLDYLSVPMHESDHKLRYLVTQHPRTSSATLQKMAQTDTVEYIREAAAKRLRRY